MSPVRKEIRVLAILALPVVIGQIGQMMLGIVDMWMVGRLGATELGAVALADAVIFGSFIMGMGFVMGIDPLVSQAHGAGKPDRARLAMQRGIVVGLIVSIPLMFVWHFTGHVLLWLGQKPHLTAIAQEYARAQVWSIAPALVFAAMRCYFIGRGNMITPTVVVLVANAFNVLANWALIFGNLGFEPMGVRGAGMATALTRGFMMLALAWWLFRREGWIRWTRAAFRGLRQVARYGMPVAIYLTLEVCAFSFTTLFAGWLPHPGVAAHIIVMKSASLAFMVPLGISLATATRVGNLLGARDRDGAQRAAWVALAMGAGVMTVSAVAFIVFGEPIARIFTNDPRAIALAAAAFPAAAAFQLFDGTQVVGAGVLRGMGRTRPAAYFNVVGFYLLALPLAVWWAHIENRGLPGIWWAMCVGLGVVALCFVAWIRFRGPREVGELAIAEN